MATMSTSDPVEERYYLRFFGAKSASNNTCVCRDCGAVVYDYDDHDAFHARIDAIERVQRSLCDQHI